MEWSMDAWKNWDNWHKISKALGVATVEQRKGGEHGNIETTVTRFQNMERWHRSLEPEQRTGVNAWLSEPKQSMKYAVPRLAHFHFLFIN